MPFTIFWRWVVKMVDGQKKRKKGTRKEGRKEGRKEV